MGKVVRSQSSPSLWGEWCRGQASWTSCGGGGDLDGGWLPAASPGSWVGFHFYAWSVTLGLMSGRGSGGSQACLLSGAFALLDLPLVSQEAQTKAKGHAQESSVPAPKPLSSQRAGPLLRDVALPENTTSLSPSPTGKSCPPLHGVSPSAPPGPRGPRGPTCPIRLPPRPENLGHPSPLTSWGALFSRSPASFNPEPTFTGPLLTARVAHVFLLSPEDPSSLFPWRCQWLFRDSPGHVCWNAVSWAVV